jgi:hypothetical protein
VHDKTWHPEQLSSPNIFLSDFGILLDFATGIKRCQTVNSENADMNNNNSIMSTLESTPSGFIVSC